MIIKAPVITEKTIANYAENNKVTFEVDPATNKADAVKMLEDVYGVKVLSTRVINRLGKTKRRAGGKFIRTQDKKIMIFQLDKGSKIDIFKQ